MTTLKYIKGLDALFAQLDELPKKLEKNVVRSALYDGATILKDRAQSNLEANGNVKTGKLEHSLYVTTETHGEKITATVKSKQPFFIGYWLEFTGAKPHKIKPKNKLALSIGGNLYKEVDHPGFSAKPFMRPALDSASDAALVVVAGAIKAKLNKEDLNSEYVEKT